MNEELELAYTKYQTAALGLPKCLSQRASAPLLFEPHKYWNTCQTKLLIVGQETNGWTGTNLPLSTLRQFALAPQGVKVMLDTYDAFDFARSYRHRNSAFWRAFRYLEENIASRKCSAMWSNLFKVDVEGSVIRNCTSAERRLLSEAQAGLLQMEIAILQPRIIIFFTGPSYDEELYRAFPGLDLRPLWPDFSSHEIAVAHSPGLPSCTVRTYHPSYLQRSRRWHLLKRLAKWIKRRV